MATRRADRNDTPKPCPAGTVARASVEAAPSGAPRSPEQTLLHVVVREQLETFLTRARDTEAAVPRFIEQCGAVTFVQRFGSAMNLNLHFHTLALDGVFPYALSRDTTHVVMERRELFERLVPLIPPPRAHQFRYHGILAPRASLRDRVTPGGKADESAERSRAERDFGASDRAFDAAGDRAPAGRRRDEPSAFGVTIEAEQTNRATGGSPGTNPSRVDPHGRARRLRWAPLLQRVFGVDALRCPHCGSRMRLLAAIEDPVVARKILGGLGLPARAPPLGSVAGDPKDSAYDEAATQEDRDLDQTPIEDDP